MTIIRTTLLLLLVFAAFGCGPRHYKMLIGAPRETFAVGASAYGSISLMQVNAATDEWRRHTLTRVACDDQACDTAIEAPSAGGYGSAFSVTPRRAGDIVVHLTVETDDGDEAEDTVTIHAADTAAVALERGYGNVGVDGGALLVGSRTRFAFRAYAADRTPLRVGELAELAISSAALDEGPASNLHVAEDFAFDFAAKDPGVAVVTANVGAVSASRTLRVVSPAEVTRITLHRKSDSPPPLDAGPGWAPDELAKDGLARSPQRSIEIVPVSELADGTTVVGGATGCRIEATDKVASLAIDDDAQSLEIRGWTDADVTLTCTIGSAVAKATVTMMDYTAPY